MGVGLYEDYEEILEAYCDCLTDLDIPRKNEPLRHVEEWLQVSWIMSARSHRYAEAVVICAKSGDIVVQSGSCAYGLPPLLIPARNVLLSAICLARALRGSPYMIDLAESYAELVVDSPEFNAILTAERLA